MCIHGLVQHATRSCCLGLFILERRKEATLRGGGSLLLHKKGNFLFSSVSLSEQTDGKPPPSWSGLAFSFFTTARHSLTLSGRLLHQRQRKKRNVILRCLGLRRRRHRWTEGEGKRRQRDLMLSIYIHATAERMNSLSRTRSHSFTFTRFGRMEEAGARYKLDSTCQDGRQAD